MLFRSYLRNLLIATAERTGFKAPPPVGEVTANVERPGIAGIGLVDKEGKSLVSTPDMPPLTAKIRAAVAKALDGEPAVIDVYLGASGQPTMGFVLPIFGIQDDAEGAKGIGGVVGVRTIGKDLYDRLKQPGDTAKTTETYMVRAKGAAVQYLTPLADGTPALKRTLAADTPDLAGGHALKQPGGFAIKLDYAGTKVLAASRAISGVPWVLIRKISREEALSATDTRLTTMLVVFVLMIVGTTVTIIAVWRHGSSVRATQAAANMKVALERFENLSKFMRVVTNSQRNVIVAVDGETKYSFANETAAREAGIPVEDMLGKPMSAVMGPIRAQAYAAVVGDDDFADEAVGLFHQHHAHAPAFGFDVKADLGAADTDGRHRGIQRHGVGVGLCDLTGNEGEDALDGRKIDGAFLGRRVVNHFVENDAAVLAHGKRGFVGQQDADGTVVSGFDDVALIDRIAFIQFHPGAVRADGEYGAR